MPPHTRVAIAVVESNGHILVGTRPVDAPLAGMSEFPGGKCLPDETPRSCAVRECREETGLLVIPREHLMTTEHQYDHGIVDLHFWRCQLTPDLPDLAEPANSFRWIEREHLAELQFPEANAEVLQLLAAPTAS